jgi:hypothetical protein
MNSIPVTLFENSSLPADDFAVYSMALIILLRRGKHEQNLATEAVEMLKAKGHKANRMGEGVIEWHALGLTP